MFDGYAAPEQYAVAEFDGKYTDIYGLGALFYLSLIHISFLIINGNGETLKVRPGAGFGFSAPLSGNQMPEVFYVH